MKVCGEALEEDHSLALDVKQPRRAHHHRIAVEVLSDHPSPRKRGSLELWIALHHAFTTTTTLYLPFSRHGLCAEPTRLDILLRDARLHAQALHR